VVASNAVALRLLIFLHDRVERFRLTDSETVVGSGADCEVRLSHPTISRRHAILRLASGIAEVEDLGSRNGTWLEGRKVRGTELLPPGSEIAFGSVRAKLQAIREGDLEPADGFTPEVAEEEVAAQESSGAHATVSLSGIQAFALDVLPGLLQELEQERPTVEKMAQTVGAAIHKDLSCLLLEIATSQGAVLFRGGEEMEGNCPTDPLEIGPLVLRATFPSKILARLHRPILESALRLVNLAGRGGASRARQSPEPSAEPKAPALPAPATVEPKVLELYGQAAKVARGNVSVLIRGESGTGKEVLARYLHRASRRSEKGFVALNCAALPRDLLEAELFGIEKGVATGVEARPGKFELAHDGTLFLDEIGDMALETQAQILRVLQEQEVFRLGGSSPRPAQVRVLAATNRDLDSMLVDGRFRADLYHRIADWVVQLPPLRERKGDIPNLAAFFLNREAQRTGRPVGGISRATMDALTAYSWPGNIRQLEKEIGRAALFLGPGDLVESSLLSPDLLGAPQGSEGLKDVLERAEKQEIERVLRETSGDTVEAARRLGIGRSTLYRRMKALDIEA